MDLPVIETSIRATSKGKPRKYLQGIGEKEPGLYHRMQPRKWQVAFYHVIKLMEWITALTALIHLSAVGAFTGDEWYSPLQPTLSSCCVFLQSLSCYCSLESAVADALNSLFSLPHIWTSDHQLHLRLVHILLAWDASWAIYELGVTEVCKLYSRVPVQTLAATEWKRRMRYGFKSLPSRSGCYITHGSETWHVILSN